MSVFVKSSSVVECENVTYFWIFETVKTILITRRKHFGVLFIDDVFMTSSSRDLWLITASCCISDLTSQNYDVTNHPAFLLFTYDLSTVFTSTWPNLWPSFNSVVGGKVRLMFEIRYVTWDVTSAYYSKLLLRTLCCLLTAARVTCHWCLSK